MGYRAIAFDMDGTLLTPDKKISAECMAAIGEAKAAGKMVLLCSGRSPSELREYLTRRPRRNSWISCCFQGRRPSPS